jgi:hypothetical protein
MDHHPQIQQEPFEKLPIRTMAQHAKREKNAKI